MSYRLLPATDAFWRPSNQMGVLNTDLAKQLGATTLGARLWRIAPGQASTRHRHRATEELYVLLEGRGRARVDEELLTVEPGGALLITPETVRQLFNDTGADQLWLVVGAPARGGEHVGAVGRRAGVAVPGRTHGAAARGRQLTVAAHSRREDPRVWMSPWCRRHPRLRVRRTPVCGQEGRLGAHEGVRVRAVRSPASSRGGSAGHSAGVAIVYDPGRGATALNAEQRSR